MAELMTSRRVVAIADDTTGALEIGALLAIQGIPCEVRLQPTPVESLLATVVDTNTRHAHSSEAFALASDVLRGLPESALVFKKTDSTLRGNIGAEIAALRVVRPRHWIIYAPAYPAAGRTVTNGVLHVEGVPVAATEFARDPRSPVTESFVPKILSSAGVQSTVVGSSLASVGGFSPEQVLVCDGSTDSDLRHVAEAVRGRTDVVLAGTGGLARYWASFLEHERIVIPQLPSVRRWLLVCGSMHPVSRRQAKEAVREGVLGLASPDELRTGADPLDELVHQADVTIRSGAADGLIVFGGETARRVFLRLGCERLSPRCELMPGVPGSLAHCAIGDLPVVTKAGGFGDANLVRCILERLTPCR